MTDSIQLWGMYHLTNKVVSVTIGGIDCGDFRVDSSGGIVVPFGSDKDGKLTPAYLLTLDGYDYGDAASAIKITLADASVIVVTVPVVIGYTYTTQGQVLRPLAYEQVHTETGPSLGMTRRTHRYSALLNNTQGVSFGTSFDNMLPAVFTEADGVTPLDDTTVFNGVYSNVIEDDYGYDSQLCWSITRPVPATIVSVGQNLEVTER